MHGFQAESHAHQQKSNVHTLVWVVTSIFLLHTIFSTQFILAGHHHPSLCAVSQLLTPAKGTLLTFVRREVLVLVLHARWHAFNLFYLVYAFYSIRSVRSIPSSIFRDGNRTLDAWCKQQLLLPPYHEYETRNW